MTKVCLDPRGIGRPAGEQFIGADGPVATIGGRAANAARGRR